MDKKSQKNSSPKQEHYGEFMGRHLGINETLDMVRNLVTHKEWHRDGANNATSVQQTEANNCSRGVMKKYNIRALTAIDVAAPSRGKKGN
jgi:hypothetical protein